MDDFLSVVSSYGIDIIIDVRSAPYSKYCPQFNKEVIKNSLDRAGIKYLFLGKELGARPDDLSCYYGRRAQFDLLRKTDLFKKGISRLKEEASKGGELAIMCSEKNPIDCHRTILISRVLKEEELEVKHILNDAETIDQIEIEKQLQRKFKLEPLLFDSQSADRERIKEAYKKQEELITYTQSVEDEIGAEH
jgi:uncharacterized protein (DUF488 family)